MDEVYVQNLKEEILYLHSLYDENGIEYVIEYVINTFRKAKEEEQSSKMIPIDITPETAKFFFSMFHGRVDVYAHRYKNGYYTVCNNRWTGGICSKKDGKKVKCADCMNKDWPSLNTVLMQHMADICGLSAPIYIFH